MIKLLFLISSVLIMSQSIAQTFQLEIIENFDITGNGVDRIHMAYGGKNLVNKQNNRIVSPIVTDSGNDKFIGFVGHNYIDLSQENLELAIAQIAPYDDPFPQGKAINFYGDENFSWISFLRYAPDSICISPFAHAPALMKIYEDEFGINDLGLSANCLINMPVSDYIKINDTLFCGAFTYHPNTLLYFFDAQGSILDSYVISERFDQFRFVNLPSGELYFIGIRLESDHHILKSFNVELYNTSLINALATDQFIHSYIYISDGFVVDENIIIWGPSFVLKINFDFDELAFLFQNTLNNLSREIIAVLPTGQSLSVVYSIQQQASKNVYREVIDLQLNTIVASDTLISKPLHFNDHPFYFIRNSLFTTMSDMYILASNTIPHPSSDIHTTFSLFDYDFNIVSRTSFTRTELSMLDDEFVFLIDIPEDTSIIACSANINAYQLAKFKVNLLPSHTAQIKYQNNFTLYPNPATSTLHITSEDNMLRQYQITDLQGRKMHSAMLPAQAAAHEIDIGQLAAGVYLLKVESEMGAMVKRFVKE